MKIFLICPVRIATEEQKARIMSYVNSLETAGFEVHYPARDTDQNDDIGYRICEDNSRAIFLANEVHIWWDKNSKGSLFDLGIAFAYGKKIHIINQEDVDCVEGKSFENMITYWHFKGEEDE